MSALRDKVDHFLFNFSYSLKVKSMILSSSATAILIAIMLVVTQYQLLESVNKQELGTLYQKQINLLQENTLLHMIGGSSESKINALLQEIGTLNETKALPLLGENSPEYETLSINYHKLLDEWDSIQDPLAHLRMISAIQTLSETVQITFHLNLNIDTGMNYLFGTMTTQIPRINNLSSETFSLASKENQTLEEQAKVIYFIQELTATLLDLKQDLLLARSQNAVIHQRLQTPESAEILNNYFHTFEQFLQSGGKDGALAKETLHQSGKLGTLLAAESLNLLHTQSHTLLIREYYGVGFITYGVFVILAAYTTRLIRRPLAGIREAAEKLAQGSIGVRIHIAVDDEVGKICRSFNELVERIEMIIRDADGISSNLAASSKGIFSTAKQLESNVIRQEQAITQIASNAKGVSRTVQDFAKSLQEVAQSATVTAHLASLGRTGLTEMEQIMYQMAKASMSIVKTLSDLQDKIGRVNSVIGTIVRIADQINLLSLNTAIRAGKPDIEHLGFSVIADKISELADQTALATLDMEELVGRIVQMVSESVAVVDQFSDQIRNQVFESTEIGNELNQLITNTQQQFEAFEEVNNSMQDQTTRAGAIHESITLLNEAAQNTTHAVRNLYLEIEYLHHSTNNLNIMTKKLTQESFTELSNQIT